MFDISFNSCRICLSSPSSNDTWENDMKSIDDRDENSSFTYSEKFTMCTGINISSDILLAKKICLQCTKILKDSFSFLVSCKKNEIILQNYIHDIVKNEKNSIPSKVTFETPSLNNKAQSLLQQNITTNQTNENENVEFLSVKKIESVSSEDGNEGCDHFEDIEIPINDNFFENEIDDTEKKCKLKIKKSKSQKLNKLDEGNKILIDVTKSLSTENKSRSNAKTKSSQLKESLTPTICDICGSLFKDRRNFEYHKQLHTGEKNFKCSICDKTFALRSYLSGHMLRTHTGVRKFECGFCDQKFYRASVFRVHQKKHTLQLDFECHICSKKFKLSHHLKRHIRIHNDERPYSCKLCGVSFRRGHHLKQHIRSRTHKDLMAKQSQRDLPTSKIEQDSLNATETSACNYSSNNQFV